MSLEHPSASARLDLTPKATRTAAGRILEQTRNDLYRAIGLLGSAHPVRPALTEMAETCADLCAEFLKPGPCCLEPDSPPPIMNDAELRTFIGLLTRKLGLEPGIPGMLIQDAILLRVSELIDDERE